MKISFVVPFAFLMAFVPAVAFAQNDTDSTVPKETTSITETAPITDTAEVTQTATVTDVVQAAEAKYAGCDEIVMEGPVWAWHGEVVTFTLTINWEGKKDRYTLYDGRQNVLDVFDPWKKVTQKKITVTKQMDPNVQEILDELYIRVQGPLAGAYCEENHVVLLMSPQIVWLPIVAAYNWIND